MAVFLGLTLFTFQTKIDFSFLGGALFASLWIMMLWGLVMAVFGFQQSYLYSLAGAIIFSLYILYDTSLLMNHLVRAERLRCFVVLRAGVISFVCAQRQRRSCWFALSCASRQRVATAILFQHSYRGHYHGQSIATPLLKPFGATFVGWESQSVVAFIGALLFFFRGRLNLASGPRSINWGKHVVVQQLAIMSSIGV